MYSFCSQVNCTDGSGPVTGLIKDNAGNFYGATCCGGIGVNGVVYKVTPGGVETVLYEFQGGLDGSNPNGNLRQDAHGNLYGVTVDDGAGNNGTLFKLTPAGVETVLYSFCSLANCADGGQPNGPPIFDTAGNLYGTSVSGGANGNGCVWEVDTAGVEKVLFSFHGPQNSDIPSGGLTIDAAGNLYGLTFDAGAFHRGSVYKLTRQ